MLYNSIGALEERTLSDIETLLRANQIRPYVLFSGGKDSLVTLNLVKDASKRHGKKVIAIHADTTVGLPGNIKYVKRICRLLKVELRVVRPRSNYFELAERWGLPRFRARWCCHALKIGPVNEYLRSQHGDKLVFDGIRAEESRERSKMGFSEYDKKQGCLTCHPLLYWTSAQVKSYLEKSSLPINPAYEQGFRRASECWCGVFKDPREFELLFTHYPGFFNRLLELEAKQRSGYAYIYSSGKEIFLRDLKNKMSNNSEAKSSGKSGPR